MKWLYAALLLVMSCSPTQKTVARVSGVSIKIGELTSQMSLSQPLFDSVMLTSQQKTQSYPSFVLARLIQEEVLVQEAIRQNITLSPEELATKLRAQGVDLGEVRKTMFEQDQAFDSWKKRQERRILIWRLLEKELYPLIQIPEEEMRRYYQKNAQQFIIPRQFRALHVVSASEEILRRIQQDLLQNKPIGDILHTYGPQDATLRGGDLGWFDQRSVPDDFILLMEQLRLGQVSSVNAIDHGYQVVKLLDVRKAKEISFDDARSQIEKHLKEEKGADAFSHWYDALAKKSRIEIYEDVLREVKSE
ncbi:MAG: peptidyl-prolyl cis-trans isomerase [Deltaproteobacteria bacterium]|nr:peptidyl-prolyl cis-trans isomerase [Deltaproteobacteria bacterium]